MRTFATVELLAAIRRNGVVYAAGHQLWRVGISRAQFRCRDESGNEMWVPRSLLVVVRECPPPAPAAKTLAEIMRSGAVKPALALIDAGAA